MRKLRSSALMAGALAAGALLPFAWASTDAAAQVEPGDPDPTPSAASDEPGNELRVWLITAGPGDAVWERYGHNALRVLNTRTGRDVSYNWGIFDFQQVDFIPRFLQGRMLYMMAPFQSQAMIDAYGRADREIILQELDLTPDEKRSLEALAERNALPENRDYFYQYFLDNCSTRVRDLLNLVLGGALEREFAPRETGTTYRYHTQRLTRVDPLIYTGMDALLGAPTDREISIWEEMFIPMTVRDEIRDFRVTRADGSSRALVLSEEVAVLSTRAPEDTAPPSWLPIYLLLGVLVGALFASLGTTGVRSSAVLRRTILAVATTWSVLFGVLGTILFLLLFTDHLFSIWNENLFLAHPLMLVLGTLLPISRRSDKWRTRARVTAAVIAGIAMLGLVAQVLPASTHVNGMFFALMLPAHLGLAWALSRPEPLG